MRLCCEGTFWTSDAEKNGINRISFVFMKGLTCSKVIKIRKLNFRLTLVGENIRCLGDVFKIALDVNRECKVFASFCSKQEDELPLSNSLIFSAPRDGVWLKLEKVEN